MKKKFMSGLLACICLCSVGAVSASAEEVTVSKGDQQKMIVMQQDTWKPSKGSFYSITDLDQDGWLEVITSTTKDDATTNKIWEVGEKSLSEVKLPWADDEVQPDMTAKEIPAFYDEEADIYYYIFDAAGQEETDDAEKTKIAVSMKDNEISAEVLEEDAKEHFADLKEMTAKAKWIDTKKNPLDGVNMEQVLEIISEIKFSVEPINE